LLGSAPRFFLGEKWNGPERVPVGGLAAPRTGEIISILARIKAGLEVEHLETLRVGNDGTVFPVLLTISRYATPSAQSSAHPQSPET
jgi:hypothetical protein